MYSFYIVLELRNQIGYNTDMIKSFKHKGLEKFYLTGVKSGIQEKHAQRLRVILNRLNLMTEIKDIDLPNLNLHKLKGDLKDCWSLKVSGNWRITFKFEDENVYIVDYQDYH